MTALAALMRNAESHFDHDKWRADNMLNLFLARRLRGEGDTYINTLKPEAFDRDHEYIGYLYDDAMGSRLVENTNVDLAFNRVLTQIDCLDIEGNLDHWCVDDAHDNWANSIAKNVQKSQRLAGIPIRTIQEAIDAGEYDVS